MQTKTITIQFTIPQRWGKQAFVEELTGAFADMNPEGADRVLFEIVKPTTNQKENQ